MILTLAIGALRAYQWMRCSCIHWRQSSACHHQSGGIQGRSATEKEAVQDVIRLCGTKESRGVCPNGPLAITHGFVSIALQCVSSTDPLILTKTPGKRASARRIIGSSIAISCRCSMYEATKISTTTTTEQKTRPRENPWALMTNSLCGVDDARLNSSLSYLTR